jgi:hypothetical protein
VIRRTVLLTTAALAAALLPASAALANASATTDVRVEAAGATLFEGPVTSAGGNVRSASDTQQRHCDGTNNDKNPLPGATATGAAVEGLRTAGIDWDARWYPGFDDYYITRMGPDAENLDAHTYWGILVNDVFTDVGGCQQQVHDGDRVLWAFDAFHQRGFLKLAATGDTGVSPRPTATVVAGQPLSVTVTVADQGADSTPFTPAGGMTVAPVVTAANGVETIDASAPETTTTAPADGTATVIFSTPGWHRIKATGAANGPIRSNRLDVCVTAAPGGSCGDAPADTQPRIADPLPPDPVGPPSTGTGTRTGGNTTNNGGGGRATGAPVIELPRFTRAGLKTGRIGVSWRILQAGTGVRSWSFSTRAAGLRTGRYVVRARGTKGTSALLALPAGRTWAVRAAFTDRLGRTVSEDVGTVLVPVDAGARAVRRTGSWKRTRDVGAWLGAIHVGRRGAALSIRLVAGRPVVQVRGVRRSADIQVSAGGKSTTYRVGGSRTTSTREIVAPARARAGTVTVRVVRGQAGIDGVGVRP